MIDLLGAISAVIGLNLVLSADNAVVIGLAARNLPVAARRGTMVAGCAAILAARLVLTLAAVELLRLPYLKIVAGVLLFVIAVRMIVAGDEGDSEVDAPARSIAAVWAMLVADTSMSIDNVLAVASAGQGNLLAVALGLAISTPIVLAAAAGIAALIRRVPAIVTAGAALVGAVAAMSLVGDPAIASIVASATDGAPGPRSIAAIAAPVGAIAVLVAARVAPAWLGTNEPR